MLRDLEVENGGGAPRIHSMDDYFITEVEKVCYCLVLSCIFFLKNILPSFASSVGYPLVFFGHLREINFSIFLCPKGGGN